MTVSWIDHAIEAALPRDLIEEAALMMDREVDVVAAMTMDTTITTTITEVDDLLTQTISLATLLAPTMTTTQQRASANPINPLMSFKNFVQNQTEDLPVEEFQRRYEQYNLDYLVYFSDSFFKASKAEEWFQDRYNPSNIVNMERDSAENSRIEAEKFKSALLRNPAEVIAACSLEPSARKFRKSMSSSKPVTDGNATAEGTTDGGETVVAKSNEDVAGRHFSGHENRTVYLSGVHACCPKSVLTGAIIARLRETNVENSALSVEDMTPERILISQPMWSNRVLDKFERSAWVVMPTSEGVKMAIDALNNLEVAVPLKGAAADATFNFKIEASRHFVHRSSTAPLPEYLGFSVRMKEDIRRAILLAKLLDEEREIPVENRVGSILREDTVVQSVKRMSDHMDLLIAYLRRVHYVAFYSARRFRDEAHMLLMSPCVAYRSKPFALVGEGDNAEGTVYSIPAEADELTTTDLQDIAPVTHSAEEEAVLAAAEAQNEAASAPTNAEEEETKDTEATITEESEEKAVATEVSTAVVPAATAGETNSVGVRVNGRFIVTADRKMESLIRDLRNRIRTRRAQSGGLVDEEDAKKLEALQEITFEKFVRENSSIEANEKCRCLYMNCGKLFQNSTFIVKHFRLKHPGAADAVLLADAEPFMRRRFDDEDISQRPLPPIEVDFNNRFEFKTVRDIMEKFQKAKAAGSYFNMGASGANNGGGRYSSGGGNGNGRHPRDRDHRDARDNYNNNNPRDNYRNNRFNNNNNSSSSFNNRDQYRQSHGNKRNRDSFEGGESAAEGRFKVTVSGDDAPPSTNTGRPSFGGNDVKGAAPAPRRYMDVDAPRDTTTAGTIDYGSIIPNMAGKRRKLSGKVTDPLLSSPPPAAAAPSTDGN
eukprot:gene9375-6716_t